MSYTADDIIGKTLIALTAVPLNRTGLPETPAFFTVKSGKTVGVVDTYLSPKPGRENVWWGFKDENGRTYYAEHKSGRYDLSFLKQQGVKTTEQKAIEKEQENETLTQKAERLLKNAFMIGAGVYVIAQFIKKG